jgi:hypothetical protein
LRLPVASSQQFLQQMTDLVGEQNLGLLAARETPLGAFEVLEFVVFSAPGAPRSRPPSATST